LLGSSGAIQTEYNYEPFGRGTTTGIASSNKQTYTGREDDGTGLYYYRSRYYSPTRQRFVSQDPLDLAAGDVNLYAYVGNNPVNYRDPFGLEKPSTRTWLLKHGTVYGFTNGRKIIKVSYWLFDFYTCESLGWVPEQGLETDWGMQLLLAAPFAAAFSRLGAAAGGGTAGAEGELIVGGGRAAGFPATPAGGVSLNNKLVATPTVAGDIGAAPFGSATFGRVYFERVPFTSFTGENIGALSEAARVLKPGGSLVIETGAGAPVARIVDALRSSGFTNITIQRTSHIRISAILGGR
jgi:RHS repeat-associated protein